MSLWTAVIAMVAVGCATPFQQKGFRGGYADARVAHDTVLVSFKGNGFTSKERVQLYLLYRCAQVTQQYGYDYFIVTNGGTEGSTGYITNYTANTNASAYGTGNAAFGSASTFGSGSTVPVHKYATDALIKMFKGQKPVDDPNAYDANETLQFLGPELGLTSNDAVAGSH
jgi:hypothetical protein